MSKSSKIGLLGITGGIGSGKTTVCRIFSVLGIPVFSADLEAGKIEDSNREVMEKLNSIAGKDLYTSGKLDRSELAGLVFNNRELLEKVNAAVHPVVFDSFRMWVGNLNAPYAIMEAAILFESGANHLVDKVLTIVTPVGERIDRIVSSHKFTREEVLKRIGNQIDDAERIRRSDY
ncbi:MAG: dephospho-CoA kinase, partial [Bacteroidales bacterium]